MVRYYILILIIASHLIVNTPNVFGLPEQDLQRKSFTDQIFSTMIGGLISGAVISAIVGFLFHKRTVTIQEQIRSQFEIIRSKRIWKEQSISELLGPVNMLLDRTEIAFKRWNADDLFLEAEIIAKSNQTIRDLLLEKGHLIPPELLPEASKLIEHYDRWLEKYDENRKKENPKHQDSFTFVGPEGYPFPRQSAIKFQQFFKNYWNDLYK